MTVYLHRGELDEVNSKLARIIEAGETVELFTARGLCAGAVHQLADLAAEQAIDRVELGASAPEAFADAYLSGLAIGLLAAERIGRGGPLDG